MSSAVVPELVKGVTPFVIEAGVRFATAACAGSMKSMSSRSTSASRSPSRMSASADGVEKRASSSVMTLIAATFVKPERLPIEREVGERLRLALPDPVARAPRGLPGNGDIERDVPETRHAARAEAPDDRLRPEPREKLLAEVRRVHQVRRVDGRMRRARRPSRGTESRGDCPDSAPWRRRPASAGPDSGTPRACTSPRGRTRCPGGRLSRT